MSETKRREYRGTAQRTYTRRAWMEWLGNAGVLSLAGLAAGCQAGSDDPATTSGDAGLGSGPGPDTLDGDTTPTPGGDGGPRSPGPKGPIQFAPTSDADTPIDPWGENTVDPQDAESIIASWSLQIDGLVETPVTLSFADLLALERQDQVTDFHCVEGWSVYDIPWNGVHMATAFDLVKPLPTATHVTFHCVEAPNGVKYDESLPLSIALEPKTMLAYGAADWSLPLRHGFPLRLVIPRLLGYKNAKTIERIELTDEAIDGFWVKRGYPYDAEVPPERLREGKY